MSRDVSLTDIPCTRHGEVGVRDTRLVELLTAAQKHVDSCLASNLSSLHYFNGQLWATWKDDASRAQFARTIDRTWQALPENGPTVHLIPSDESYDFQEDVMNNADADSQ
jgi:hypothetical protein